MVTPPPRRRSSTRVRITKAGQITLPAAIRKRMGVELGDYVTIEGYDDGTVRLEPHGLLTMDQLGALFTSPVCGSIEDQHTTPISVTDLIDAMDRTPMVRSAYRAESRTDDIG